MRSAAILIILVFVAVASTQAVPPLNINPQDNPEVYEEISRLLRAARMFPFGYYGGIPASSRSAYSIPTKRNSELINSLLGLPKNMNDAGRK